MNKLIANLNYAQCMLQLEPVCNNGFGPVPIYSEKQIIDVVTSITDKAASIYTNRYGAIPSTLDLRCQYALMKRTLEAYRAAPTTDHNRTFSLLNACCTEDECPKRLYCEAVVAALVELVTT